MRKWKIWINTSYDCFSMIIWFMKWKNEENMKVFMKKAELHNIQFKKSQIQWNPITRVCNWKGSGYCASQLHSQEPHRANTLCISVT